MSVRESVKKVGMLEKEKKKERKIREKKRETEREREDRKGVEDDKL